MRLPHKTAQNVMDHVLAYCEPCFVFIDGTTSLG
jgi:hypothetical protein